MLLLINILAYFQLAVACALILFQIIYTIFPEIMSIWLNMKIVITVTVFLTIGIHLLFALMIFYS